MKECRGFSLICSCLLSKVATNLKNRTSDTTVNPPPPPWLHAQHSRLYSFLQGSPITWSCFITVLSKLCISVFPLLNNHIIHLTTMNSLINYCDLLNNYCKKHKISQSCNSSRRDDPCTSRPAAFEPIEVSGFFEKAVPCTMCCNNIVKQYFLFSLVI